MAAILGYSKWTSPYTAWLRITGQVEVEDNEAMALGRDLEDGLVKNLIRNLDGFLGYAKPGTIQHPDFPWWIATPDAIFSERKEGAEIKVRGFHMTAEFQGKPGDSGEWDNDLIPMADLMQCQWGMGVKPGYDTWWFCPYFGGKDFRLYKIRRDANLIEAMGTRARDFWEAHIDPSGPQVPPDVDGHPATTEHLKSRFPHDNGDFLPALDHHQKWAAEYRDLDSKIKEMEVARNERKNLLIEAVGDAKGIEGVCNHTYVARKAAVDFKALAQSYPGWEQRSQDHMKSATGYRRFTLSKELS